MEGWHSKFQKLIVVPNPLILRSSGELKDELKKTCISYHPYFWWSLSEKVTNLMMILTKSNSYYRDC